MSIATQVKELYDRRKYESIVSIFQDVDLENRDEQYWGVKPLSSRWCALMMMFAHAVLEESNEEWLNLRRMLVKAKNALYLCHERIGEDLQWCLMNAQIFDALDLREDAWHWYAHCFELARISGKPKEQALKIFSKQFWEINRCFRFSINQVFDYPFVDRVKRAWKAFELDEAQIYKELTTVQSWSEEIFIAAAVPSSRASSRIMAAVNAADIFTGNETADCIIRIFDIFSEAFDGLSLLIRVHNSKAELEFAAQGSLPRLYQLIEMVRHAPPHLSERWTFSAGLSRHSPAQIINSMSKAIEKDYGCRSGDCDGSRASKDCGRRADKDNSNCDGSCADKDNGSCADRDTGGINGSGYALNISPETVMVRLEPADNNAFRLIACVPDCQSSDMNSSKQNSLQKTLQGAAGLYCKRSSETLINDLSLLCSLLLGDAARLRWISSIELIDAHGNKESFVLSSLPEELKKRGARLLIRSKDVPRIFSMEQPSQSALTNNASQRPGLISGTTSCLPLVSEYMAGKTKLADQLCDDGACAVFLFWPSRAAASHSDSSSAPPEHAPPADSKAYSDSAATAGSASGQDGAYNAVDVEFNLDLARRLGEYITADSDGPCATITATVCGQKFSWIDMLAWDVKKVTNRAREYLESTSVPMSWMHSFCPVPESVLVHIRPEFESLKEAVREGECDLDAIRQTALSQGAGAYIPVAPANNDNHNNKERVITISSSGNMTRRSH